METQTEAKPVTHIILSTSSSDENYNGDCDYAIVPLDRSYLEWLLKKMEHVAGLKAVDPSVFALECFTDAPDFFEWCDASEALIDMDGNPLPDVPRGEVALFTADPQIPAEAIQRTECGTVIIEPDGAYWEAYPKHTNVHITTSTVDKAMLQRILDSQHKPTPLDDA